MNEEIGRELAADELKPRSIVVIEAPGHEGMFLTIWFMRRSGDVAEFWSGTLRMAVINRVRDNRLYDDHDRLVRVFEYLGKP